MTDILIYVQGGHSKVVADLIEQLPEYVLKGHLDDSDAWMSWADKSLLEQPTTLAIAIGDNNKRAELYKSHADAGFTMPALIHPTAYVARSAHIMPGTVVLPHAVVGAGAWVGTGCIINTGATVDHDCKLGDFVHICPGTHLAGMVTIGDQSIVGIGSSVRQEIKIGSHVVIGAGSVVVSDIPNDCTAFGVPAKAQTNPPRNKRRGWF